MHSQRIDEPLRVPLLALALPAALVAAGLLVERANIFPVGSRGAGLAALILVVASALSVWPIFVIVRRLIAIPSTRRWPHFALLVISVLALVPAAIYAAVLLAGE